MATARTAAETLLRDIAPFSQAAHRSLRPYQLACARAVLTSIRQERGQTITIMFARQMGKNETSAALEAYLLALYARQGGMVVKAAPSFKPQIVNSMLRLRTLLDANPVTRGRWRPSYGYIYQLGSAGVTFLSADQHANVVGATASLLLEVDEAQDVDPDKYARDFRPMASSTNATTVMYGTAWAADSLLERQKQINVRHEEATGEQLHFEFDWTHLGRIQPPYHRFVEAEMARLGADHPIIETQYLLHCLADAGRLFSLEQRRRLQGDHHRERAPTPGHVYVAGIDFAGEDEQAEDAAIRALKPKRDSTVVTIAALGRDASGRPSCRVVDQHWWTGRDHPEQLDAIEELWGTWQLSAAWVDASGIGAGISSFLAARHGDRVEQVTFTQQTKSALGFGMLGMINTERLKLYTPDGSPEAQQCQWEIEHCRYELRTGEIIRWFVPQSEGHDDFVVSLALCAAAADAAATPAAGGLARAQPLDEDLTTW